MIPPSMVDGPAQPALARTIGRVQATALVVGTIIGASIFVQPAEMARDVPSVGGLFAVWVIAGLLTMAGALICAELASVYPHTGGVYVFLRETLSPIVAFLWGWAMFWSMHSGIIAALGVVFARYCARLLPGEISDTGIRVVAIAAIALLSAINYVGLRHGTRLQTAFTIGKVAAILLIIGIAFALGAGGAESTSTAVSDIGWREYARATAGGLFAFGGWHMVTYAAGETIEARRTIPFALVTGTLIVTACYIAMNAAYLFILPFDVFAASTRVAADAADALLGGGGGTVMSALVVFSAFGALAGIVLAGPRVYFSMAQDRLLFGWLGGSHPRFQTPHRAIVLQAIWSSVLVATGTYRALFSRVIYTEWIFFGLMAIGLLLARRRTGDAPAWRMPLYPLVCTAFVAASAMVVAGQLASTPRDGVIGLLMVLSGIPIYLFWRRPLFRQP